MKVYHTIWQRLLEFVSRDPTTSIFIHSKNKPKKYIKSVWHKLPPKFFNYLLYLFLPLEDIP